MTHYVFISKIIDISYYTEKVLQLQLKRDRRNNFVTKM